MPERFPPPWMIRAHEASYEVFDANGFAVAFVYFEVPQRFVGTNSAERMTKDQARRIAQNIAKLPALLAKMSDR